MRGSVEPTRKVWILIHPLGINIGAPTPPRPHTRPTTPAPTPPCPHTRPPGRPHPLDDVNLAVQALALIHDGKEQHALDIHVGRRPVGPQRSALARDDQRAAQARPSIPRLVTVAVVQPEDGGAIVGAGAGALGDLMDARGGGEGGDAEV